MKSGQVISVVNMELLPDVLEAEAVPETLNTNSILMWLLAQKDFIAIDTCVLLEGK
jgi:hypothetical protein